MSTSRLSIRVENQGNAVAVVEAHNRRVAKLNRRHGQNIAPATLTVLGTRRVKETGEGGVERVVFLADLEITAEDAVISGWQVCAVLSKTEVGYLASRVAGATLADLEPFIARAGSCDHCKATRPRNTTYVLKMVPAAEVLLTKLVGSTCVKDFTGHKDPRALISYADMLSGLEAELEELESSGGLGFGGGRSGEAVALETFLAYVRQNVRLDGWVSRAKASDTGRRSTADLAWEDLEKGMVAERAAQALMASDAPERDPETGDLQPELAALKDLPSEEDRKLAAEDLAMVEERLASVTEPDDFEEKVGFVVSQGYAFAKNKGMAAAIYAMADRMRKDAAVKAARGTRKDEWMSVEGKRQVFTFKCVYKKVMDSDNSRWGSSTLYLFVDSEGREAKIFSTNLDLKQGVSYDIKATVKKHDLYQGKKSTLLSRGALVKTYEATTEAPAAAGQ